jgi:hypothetical protein
MGTDFVPRLTLNVVNNLGKLSIYTEISTFEVPTNIDNVFIPSKFLQRPVPFKVDRFVFRHFSLAFWTHREYCAPV